MTTWLSETRFEDPDNKPDEIKYDPETGEAIEEVLKKLKELEEKN